MWTSVWAERNGFIKQQVSRGCAEANQVERQRGDVRRRQIWVNSGLQGQVAKETSGGNAVIEPMSYGMMCF